MPVKTVAVLKTFFETGDRPTESQFVDLIDSFIHKNTGVVITAKSYDAGTGLLSFTFSDASTISLTVPSNELVQLIATNLALAQQDITTKVDKVLGKGLSTEDYTTAEKNKLASLENYIAPTSEAISFITGLQAALDEKALDSEVVKSVNDILPDAQGNVTLPLNGLGNYDLSNTLAKTNKTYFGADVYAILLQIPAPVNVDEYTFTHNLDIDKYLAVEQWTDGIPQAPSNPVRAERGDLFSLVPAGTDIVLDTNSINTTNYVFPNDVFVYLEFTINEIIIEGVSADAVGSAAIGQDPV